MHGAFVYMSSGPLITTPRTINADRSDLSEVFPILMHLFRNLHQISDSHGASDDMFT